MFLATARPWRAGGFNRLGIANEVDTALAVFCRERSYMHRLNTFEVRIRYIIFFSRSDGLWNLGLNCEVNSEVVYDMRLLRWEEGMHNPESHGKCLVCVGG